VRSRSGCHYPLDLVIGVRRSVHRLGKPAALAYRAVVRDVVGTPVQYVDDSRVMFSPTPEGTHDQMLGRGRLADQQSESARHVPASLVGRSTASYSSAANRRHASDNVREVGAVTARAARRHVPIAGIMPATAARDYDLFMPDASQLARRVEANSAARVCGPPPSSRTTRGASRLRSTRA